MQLAILGNGSIARAHISAVIVCSPTVAHAEKTERALRAGKLLRDRDRVLMPRPSVDNSVEAVGRQDAEFLAAIDEQREPAVSGRSVRPATAALQAAQDTLALTTGA